MDVSERESVKRIEELHLSTQRTEQVDNDGRRRVMVATLFLHGPLFCQHASLFLRYFKKLA